MKTEDYVLSFEAVKTSFRQTKDGYHLTLVIHPNDVPSELFGSWVGSRYHCSLVELNDQDQPIIRERAAEAQSAIAAAGQMCRSPRFQVWIESKSSDNEFEPGTTDEEKAAILLRRACSIDSRSELVPENAEAMKKFDRVRSMFVSDVG